MNYSINDTIENYESIFREFKKKYDNYSDLDKNKKLIYFTSGLGLSNSIHEKFIKSIIEEYINIKRTTINISNTRKETLIRIYKAPKQIKNFINLLNLDLEEAFNLMKTNLPSNYNYIDSFDSLIFIVSEQRNIRNVYLHGDFNFEQEIDVVIFKDNIIDFQIIHNFLFTLIKYSFNKNSSNLPDLSTIVLPSRT